MSTINKWVLKLVSKSGKRGYCLQYLSRLEVLALKSYLKMYTNIIDDFDIEVYENESK